MKNILFYKYSHIGDTKGFRDSQFELCKKLNLLGTLLIADEGINGCLSGTDKEVEEYKSAIKKISNFYGIEFKESDAKNHTFRRLSVRVRKEIVTSNFDVDIGNAADYISPKDLKKVIDNGEDIVLIDARNSYESKIGKFKNAVAPKIRTFRQFKSQIECLKKYKNKRVVTYCTGGIRCEKASALLRESGFSDVLQLHGGILNYGKECGNAHWEGKCFVFDSRGAVDIDPNNQAELISQCAKCNLPSADYHNCSLAKCDKRFIACQNCFEILEGCCTKMCRNELRKSNLS